MAGSRSPLSPADIGERLQAQYGDDVLGVEEVHGHAVVRVTPQRYPEIARFLRDDPDLDLDFFDFLGVTDFTPKGGGFQVATHVYSTRHNHHVRLKVDCDGADPRCPTVADVWPGADWHEREGAEMFGVVFEGHRHLVKLLLPEQFEGHPLRKDFPLITREAKPWPGAAEGEEIEE